MSRFSQKFVACMHKNGREVSFGFFLVFFWIFFRFLGFPCVFLFFWVCSFRILTFSSPLSSFSLQFHVFPIFLVFVPFILLHSLSLPMKHGCCCICSCCMSCFVLPFFSLFYFLFLRAVLGRGVAVRGVILKNKSWRGIGGEGAAPPPPDALGVVAFVRVAFLVLFFSFYS